MPVVLLSLALAEPAALTFADTCLERESGDVAGHVLTITGGSRPRATFLWSEGSLMGPVAATVARRGPALTFTARSDAGVFRFKGRIEHGTLAGTLAEPWAGRPRTVVLGRQALAAAEHPIRVCPALNPPR